MGNILENNPLVTVNILSYNRKEELRNTLEKVYAQDYKNIEVIVVDNASNDGSPEMVKIGFPNVILVKMERNVGISGWNEGFKIAKGKYILVLDDDSYPINNTIKVGVNKISSDSRIGVLALAINNSAWGHEENPEYENDELLTFTGCGAIISSTLLQHVGFFEELLFIYLHEIEFSMKVIDAGFLIVFEKNAKIIHQYSNVNRGKKINYRYDERKDFYFFRNRIIIYFLHFRISISTSYFLLKILIQLIVSIFDKTLYSKIHGAWAVTKLVKKIYIKRKILSEHTQSLYLKKYF